jgi:hypothetical protein
VLLLVAGLLAIAAGLLLGTIGSFEIGWGDGAAVAASSAHRRPSSGMTA